jgi:dihydrofolate reductase
MNITLVVAASENNAIGKDNKLLWHLPKDMRFFKNTTWAMPILMGRKTFESMGNRLLPGRMNIIISNQKGLIIEGAIVVNNLAAAIEIAKTNNYKELMVIGGGQIYDLALPLANKIWYTRVHTNIDGDTYFPTLDKSWNLSSVESHQADEKHLYSFDFECWQRN